MNDSSQKNFWHFSSATRAASLCDLYRIIVFSRDYLSENSHIYDEAFVSFATWIFSNEKVTRLPLLKLLLGYIQFNRMLIDLLHNCESLELTDLIIEHWLITSEWPHTSIDVLLAPCVVSDTRILPLLVSIQEKRFTTLHRVTEENATLLPWSLIAALMQHDLDAALMSIVRISNKTFEFDHRDDAKHRLTSIGSNKDLPSLIRFAAALLFYARCGPEEFFVHWSSIELPPISTFFLAVCHFEFEKFRNSLLLRLADASEAPFSRIQASMSLLSRLEQLERSCITQIPGFPLPWSGQVPISPTLRRCILKQWARIDRYYRNTDHRLIVEGTLNYRDDPRDPEIKFSRFHSFIQELELHVFGPKSIEKYIGYGVGNYHVYYVICTQNSQDQAPAFVHACLFVNNHGTFARIKIKPCRNTKEAKQFAKKNFANGALPSLADVLPKLEQYATQHLHLEILTDEILNLQFDSLSIYWFGGYEPARIKTLLFYWQD